MLPSPISENGLELWHFESIDPNINRDHLLIKYYLPTKFERFCGKALLNYPLQTVLENIPTDQPTYTNRHVQFIGCPFFFEGGAWKWQQSIQSCYDWTLNIPLIKAYLIRGAFSIFVPSLLKECIAFHQTSLLDDVHKILAVFTGHKLCFGYVFQYTPHILKYSRSGLALTLKLPAWKSFLWLRK